MSLDITGKVIKVLDEVSGQGRNGTWVKREFVVETPGQYPKSVCFTCWGDRANTVSQLQPGDEVTVSFDPESREYNDRWFTDLKAWRIEKGAGEPPAGGGRPAPAASTASYPEVQNAEGDGGGDDLPF
ncbi:MAG: DUF3127 domain-containing protein [Catalinimonas sp.]